MGQTNGANLMQLLGGGGMGAQAGGIPAWQSSPLGNTLGQLLNGQQGGMPQPIGIPQRQYLPGFSQSPQIGQVQGPAPFAPTPGYTPGTGGGTPGLRPPTQPPAPTPQEQIATWLQNRGGRNPFAGDGIGF